MKKLFLLIFTVSALIALFGCGHFENGNPVGTTGGSSSGYGENNNSPLPLNTTAILILGEWKRTYDENQYYILSFAANGDFARIRYYYGNTTVYTGTYIIGHNNYNDLDYYEVSYDNNDSEYYYFKIEGNKLYLLYSDGQINSIYTKVED